MLEMVSVAQQQKDRVPAVPRVLILLATYNGAPWLAEQVDSILAQRGVEVSLLIGDDLSKDATRSLVQEKWGDDARVTLHAWDRSSGSAGANFRRLYRFADPEQFDLVALADQDDVWAADKLQSAAAALESSGAVGYSCSVTSFWPDGRERVMVQRPVTSGGDFLFEGAGQGCTFVMSAGFFARVRTFCNEHCDAVEALHYHDWLIYLLSRAWGLKWYFDAVPKMRYRQHDGNEIGSRGGLTSITKRLELVRNGWYRQQVVAAAQIYALAHTRSTPVHDFLDALNTRDSIVRRMKLAWFCLWNGRRRFSDRVVLVFASAVGWL
jgi:rhamnosyltransferase